METLKNQKTKTIHDPLKVKFGETRTEAQKENETQTTEAAKLIQWGETSSKLKFPDIVEGYGQNLSDVFGASHNYCCFSLFAAAAAAIRNKAVFKAHNFTNFCNLYFAFTGRAGTGKSQPLSRAFAPLKALDVSRWEAYQSELKEYETRQSDQKGKAPHRQIAVVNDITPEARDKTLNENRSGITLKVDELAQVLNQTTRYTKQSNEIEKLLTLFDSGELNTIRKNSESYYIENVFFAISGTIQESVLKKQMAGLIDNGYWLRFCFVPIGTDKAKLVDDEIINSSWCEQWKILIERLDSYQYGTLSATRDASQLLKDGARVLETRCNAAASDSARGFIAKQKIILYRLSLLNHVILMATGRETPSAIDGKAVRFALAQMGWLMVQGLERLEVYDTADTQRPEKKLSKAELIRNIIRHCEIKNTTALADAIGYDSGNIRRLVKQFREGESV